VVSYLLTLEYSHIDAVENKKSKLGSKHAEKTRSTSWMGSILLCSAPFEELLPTLSK